MNKPNNVDDYISKFPENIQEKLQQIREIIKKSAPDAEEVISYNMPAYRQIGVLVYFAGYKNHIGFYPTSSPIRAFKEKLIDYKTSKGAIQFPVDKPFPRRLIAEIVKYRIKEDSQKIKKINK